MILIFKRKVFFWTVQTRPLIIHRSPKKIEKLFRHVYDDLFLSDPHAADGVKSVAYERAKAKLRTIQAQQSVEPNLNKLKIALEVFDMCYCAAMNAELKSL